MIMRNNRKDFGRKLLALLCAMSVLLGSLPMEALAEAGGSALFGVAIMEPTPQLAEGTLQAKEDVYVTGLLPADGVAEATAIKVDSPDGNEVLLAYDVKIYASEAQRKSGKAWQPDEAVQVHFRSELFEKAKQLKVYHFADAAEAALQPAFTKGSLQSAVGKAGVQSVGKSSLEGKDETPAAEAEYIGEVTAEDGWVSFEATGFSVYVVTGVIEKDIEIEGQTYRVSLSYGPDAGIPDGSTLEVTPAEDVSLEEAAALMGYGEDDIVFYARLLDIAIMYEGEEIEPTPGAEVTVTVKLLDATEGANIDVFHLTPTRGTEMAVEPVKSQTDADGSVIFTTDSFSLFGFGSMATELFSWTTDLLENTFFGKTETTQAMHGDETVDAGSVAEGLTLLDAFSVTRSSDLWLKIKSIANLVLGELESVSLYTVENGRLSELVRDGIKYSDVLSLSLADFDGLALVRDSGLRRLTQELGEVVLNGMMPKGATATAVDKKDEYASFAPVEGAEIETLAAFDITIENAGAAWQPGSGEPVTVTIDDPAVKEALAAGKSVAVWHATGEGAYEEVKGLVVKDGVVSFAASGFSDYVVVATELTKTVTTSDGLTYDIHVTYKNTAGIPMEGTDLLVSEILPSDAAYASYVDESARKVGTKAENVEFARAFDIKIVDENDHNIIYEPAGDVTVSITLVGSALDDYANVGVLHFVEDENTESFTVYDVDSIVNGESVEFTTSSFSVYVVAGYTIEKEIVASDGNTYRITVNYDELAGIPMEGAELMVREVLPDTDEHDFYYNMSLKTLNTDENHLALSRAFDIKIVDAANHDVVYEPHSAVDVSITLVDAALTDYADVSVLHFENDTSVTDVDASIADVDTVQFTTDSFSVYAVSGTVHVRTFYFYTFDEYLDYVPYYLNTDIGTEDSQTYMQIVREGETPVAPQNPVNPQDQEATFSGWYQGNANTADGPTATVPYTFSAVPDLSEDDSVYLYAKFSRYIYVIFHDQYDAGSKSFPVAFTRRIDLNSEGDWYVDVTQYSVSYEDPNEVDNTAMVFVGWSDAPITTPGAALNDDGDTVTQVNTQNGQLWATQTTHLYPIYAPVKWISFYSGPSGSHATYFTDTYYLNGVGPENLPGRGGHPAMTRDGNYEFAGWYVNAALDANDETVITGADCVKVADADGSLNTGASDADLAKLTDAGITFENTAASGETPSWRIKLTGNVTLYAYWTAKTTANYTVVIVKQNATDTDDIDESNNTYSYSESFTLSGAIDVTLNANDSLFYNYKNLNTCDAYNALHGTALTAETNEAENPYANYTLSTERSDSSVTVTADGSGILYFRYNWNTKPSITGDKFTLRFVDPMAEPEYAIKEYVAGETEGTPYDDRVFYSATLSTYVPPDPTSTVSPAGLIFNGWYADRACTTRAIFHAGSTANDLTDEEKASLAIKENGVTTGYKPYVFFASMPAADMTFYAGWTRQWFLIKIDPNYGELYKHVYTNNTQTAYEYETVDGESVPKFTGTGSTWFWKEYGDTFQEYTTVRRDYVESDSGSWYYVNHDRAYHGYPDTWVSGESGERKTYYTKDLGEATEFTTFEHQEGVYRYAGWYEVLFDENGNEIGEADSRYDFSSIVNHNITLRLRWQKVGAFYLQYDAGSGTLRHDEENEVLYLELDGDSYADDADVLITRSAAAPAGYEFVGWRIRSDESGTVYRAGQTFHLLSRFMATVQGKRTVFLDAVYEQVPTATIVYHANGGSVAGSVTAETIDYGGYPNGSDFDFSNTTLVKTADLTGTEATARVSHIVNNSVFDLSDGMWLSMTDATFAGWCENRVFDPDDTEHPLLTVDGSGNYRVGANAGSTAAEQTVHLYAIWQVDVKYHLNPPAGGMPNFGGTWDATYTLSGDGDTYTSSAYVGSTLSWPPHDPVDTGSGSTSFLGWATRTGESESYTYTPYNFSQPVAGALDLYAQWGTAPTCDVLVVDSSAYPTIAFAPWVDRDNNGTADGDASITLTSEHQTPAALIAAVTNGANNYNSSNSTTYAFSFATVGSASDMQNIREERIDAIYYSPQDSRTHLIYSKGTADERDVALGDGEKLYFVYYQVQTPAIGYLLMELSGYVTDITSKMINNPPTSIATLNNGNNLSADTVFTISSSDQPMNWLPASVTNELDHTVNKTDITHYNFAIGAQNASNSVDLAHKTQAYTGNETGADARPDLYFKNTWQGLFFSQDGATWFSAGTNPKLYVVFYTETPTVITLYNSTVGLAADMETQFTYDYWIEEVFLGIWTDTSVTPNVTYNNGDSRLIFTTRNLSTPYPQQLSGGDTFSAFTTTNSSHTYRVTFVLKPESGYTVTRPTTILDPATKLPVSGSSPEIAVPVLENGNVTGSNLPSWVSGAGDTRDDTYHYSKADVPYTFSYTVRADDGYCGKSALIPFTNTRSVVNVDLHVAKADLNGNIYHAPEWRVAATGSSTVWDSANAYTVQLTRGETKSLFDGYTYDLFTQNVDLNYKPGALIYGQDRHTSHSHSVASGDNDLITLDVNASLGCYRLSYELVDPSNPNVYELYMRDGSNAYRYPLAEMSEQIARGINGVTHPDDGTVFYRLYYLFYPAVTVYYVVENADGSLSPVKGSTDGTTESETITYNGEQAKLNSHYDGMQADLNTEIVQQGQKVGIWTQSLEISQTVGNDANGNPIFNIPPLLDNGTQKLDLIYYKLGASTQANPATPHTNISAFPGTKDNGYIDPSTQRVYTSGVTEELVLHIGIKDHRLQWQFVDEPAPQVLDNWPVIYAIYRERGYNLTVTKTVTADTGYNEPYTVTITSVSINRDQYTVSGTGYSTIDATPAVPAANGNPAIPGVITFDVRDGDSVTIQGLIPGSYTVVETGNENDSLSAKTVVGSTEEDVNVTDNSLVSITLGDNTELRLTNAPKEICRVGALKFRTLTSAVAYIADHSANLTGTIEMLTDYLMPASDTPVIPAYLNITLTTANDYVGNDTATITRKGNLTTPMISNLGTLTLGNVILDGNSVSGSAMISNEGTLTLGGSISVIKLNTNTITDNGVSITTTTATPDTVPSTSPVLEKAAGSGTGGAICSLKGAVSMTGGAIESCSATQGGAIYAAAGTVTVSGGSILDNTATEGGAIYYAGEDKVTVSGGDIGTIDDPNDPTTSHGNTARNGGAIYMASGTIDVTGGSIDYNTATGSGGGIYAYNAYVNVNGSADISHNTAVENGGAVHMETLTFKVSGGTLSYNSAANGGAIWSNTGSVEISGGEVSVNQATTGCGGAVYTSESAFSMTGGTIRDSIANGNGGGVYAEAGSVTVSGSSTIMSNNTTNGSGGGIYAATGAVSLNGTNVSVHGNDALQGYGGALYVGSGAATITNAKLGITPATDIDNSNTAINGSGVFVNTGSVTIDGGNIMYNVASEGGAVGVGSAEARLNFQNKVIIQNNTMRVSVGEPVASNVYLNFDTDAILNFQSLSNDSSTYVGIYVSNDNALDGEGNPVTVPDGNGTRNVTVLEQRGVPSTRFGVYVSTDIPNRLGSIHNDRTPNLTVKNDATNKKLYWIRYFAVKVYYVTDYSQGLPFGNKDYTGDFGTTNQKKVISSYNPPVYQMAASEIATDLRNTNSNMVSDSAVFGHAFVQQSPVSDMHYADYITEANWVSDRWEYTTSTGSTIDGQTETKKETLIFIYTEPYYLSIENNARDGNQDLTLVISGLTVTVNGTPQNVINNYGYVFARNDEIQDELRPVQASDLVLKTGESIRILLPGGKNMNYSLTGQYYSAYDPAVENNNVPYSGTVDYRQRLDSNPAGAPTGSVNAPSVFVSGNTPGTAGQTHELIFGGERSICRVVADSQIAGAASTEYVDMSAGEGATAGKCEYTFKSPEQAYAFIEKYEASFRDGADATKVTATIEMLMDYMMPASEQVSLSTGNSLQRDITFQTAVDGYFRYDPDNTKADGTGTKPRATISRASGNLSSFIAAPNGTLTSGNYVDTLKVQNLIFDGKSFGGNNIKHGIIDTNGWNVEIDRCDFMNCQAEQGGGIFISSVTPVNSDQPNTQTPHGRLTVTNSNFKNCQSLKDTNKYGGGGIWTSMKDVTIEDCTFTSCYCVQQGGAVFHYVNNYRDYESSSTISGCTFEGCSAGQAAGSIECGAKVVRVTNTTFRNSTSNKKNGGALNIWSGNSEGKSGMPTTDCWVYLTGCTFEDCYALNGTGTNGNGGAMRSTATHNTITNCTFTNNIGTNGGAMNFYNENAVETTISGCTFTGCSARERGGAIYCASKTLTIDSYTDAGTIKGTEIRRCTAPNQGGAVYHGVYKNTTNSRDSFTMRDAIIDTCSSTTKAGGGVYTTALTVSLTDSTVQNCSTVAANQNGGGVYLVNSTATTISGTTISGCTATGQGGGVYHAAKGTFTVSGSSVISGNIAQGSDTVTSNNVTYQQSGGGIYTKALTFTLQNSSVTDNQGLGSGGGICQNFDGNGSMTVDGATVTGNICGGMGGGLFTLTNMTLKGVTTVTRNRLTTNSSTAGNAAGVYLRDGVSLSLGVTGGTAAEHVFDITNNRTVDGTLSDLRLPDITASGETVNDNKVKVYCDIGGEIRVVNAKKKLTQFGMAQGSLANPAGFTDEHKVFWADDGSLYGIVDRTDTTGKKIIWGGDPICKITDGNGRLLYIDSQHVRPAVFDRLDDGTGTGTSTTSAFSTLRGTAPLYYINGEAYTGNDYKVKMLVENYTAEYYIIATGGTGRNVTLTTAKTTDSLYPYRGREGTRCTILRDPRMDTGNALITAKTNLKLTNIVLDGGSENGVTAGTNTRVITADCGSAAAIQITLDRNATLQNAKVTAGSLANNTADGKGGGVYLNWGARLAVTGGAIRNCEAVKGGAVYIDGGAGAFTMSVGTITRCTATGNGGGVYFNKGTLTTDGSSNPVSGFMRITGGSITRCTAESGSGGGVYLNGGNRSRTLYMSGGSIASNYAAQKGGGIFVGDGNVRIYFSGAPYVHGSTSGVSVAADKACNLEMDQTFTRTELSPGTVIVSSGLNRGAKIGVYVPGSDNGTNALDSLYDKHGAEMDPFATFTDGNERGLNYFLNDRNGMKGGRLDNPDGNDYKIYWRIIYALSVKKQVLSDDPADMTTYRFRLTLTGEIENTSNNTKTTPDDINGNYGDMTFTNGIARFTLTNGQTKTADLLPLGFSYTIEEILSPAEQAHFHTSVEHWDSDRGDVVTQSTTVTGEMKEQTHFNYLVTFSNLHAICKITDEQGRLLYTHNIATDTYVPAVYSSLVTAFNRVNAGNDNNWLRLGDDGKYYEDYPSSYQIQMLVPECELEGAASLMYRRIALLTTADKDAEDGFPYVGARDSAAKITRGYTGQSMITVESGSLTLGNITLDGGSEASTPRSSTANGGILNVASGASLTVGTGSTLQNAKTSGSGAAIYLTEGSTMNISGAPVFSNNVKTGAVSGTPKNGNDATFYSGTTAPQDIYLAGYTGTTANSLVVTGDIDVGTIGQGSITVWAAENPHYVQNQQFAIMSGGTYLGLDAFRNARPDSVTENPLKNEEGTPLYLYGIARGTDVYWSGSMDLIITKTITGDFADYTATFPFAVTVTGLAGNYQCDYARYTYNETNHEWVQDTETGSTGKLSVGNGGNLTASSGTPLNLGHNQRIVISIPRGTMVTVSETNGYYTASYQVGTDAAVAGSVVTGGLPMTEDRAVTYTNTLNAPSPTGYRADLLPFALMLAIGLLLLAVRKRRRA